MQIFTAIGCKILLVNLLTSAQGLYNLYILPVPKVMVTCLTHEDSVDIVLTQCCHSVDTVLT